MSGRYREYREIMARFASECPCGQPIAKGDAIGYAGRGVPAICASCWHVQATQQREARAYDETGSDCSYDS